MIHPFLLPTGCQPGMHRARDSDDGLAGEDAAATRGVSGWRSWRRGRGDPGKVERVGSRFWDAGGQEARKHLGSSCFFWRMSRAEP